MLSYWNKLLEIFFASVKNPYLEASEWGWQIDPLGFADYYE